MSTLYFTMHTAFFVKLDQYGFFMIYKSVPNTINVSIAKYALFYDNIASLLMIIINN